MPQSAPALGTMAPAVELQDVCFQYPGADRACLSNITLRIEQGERLGILGPNGGGKSTLLKLVLGLLRPLAGRIRVQGESPDVARRRGLVGYVPQRSEVETIMPLSVLQVVLLGAGWRTPPWRRLERECGGAADRALDMVDARALSARPIGELSGGQFQRIMIARAIAMELSRRSRAGERAGLLVLDEPTVGVDAAGQHTFAQLMRRLHADLGLTILTVSHDLRAIIAGSDRVACLSRTLHSHTSPQGLTPEVIAELFSHDVAGILGNLHVHAHRPDECGQPTRHECGCAHHDCAEGAKS